MQEATSLFRSILNRLSLDFGPDEFELEDADIERDLQYGRGELQVELAEPSDERGSRYFVVLYEPGSSWRAGRSLHEQPLDRHLAYMMALREGGSLILGGPFADDSGGMIIVRAADPSTAAAMVSKHPAVVTGVLRAAIHPWHPLVPAVMPSELRWGAQPARART